MNASSSPCWNMIAGALGQLARYSGTSLDNVGDLLQRVGKHVVQDEHGAFKRCYPFEDSQEAKRQRLSQQDRIIGARSF